MSKNEIQKRRDLLQSKFNLLPEKSINGNCSLDEDLIEFMVSTRPDLDIVFNVNPNGSINPVKIYENAVRMLADFEQLDIIKIISAYLPGVFWDTFSQDEKSNFVIETIDAFDKKLEEKKLNEGKKKQTKKIGNLLHNSLSNPLQIALALQEQLPIYYDSAKNFWMWDEDLKKYNRIDETEIMV